MIKGMVSSYEEIVIGKCGARINIACQGTKPLRKACDKCEAYDPTIEIDYYPKTLKEVSGVKRVVKK